MVLQNLGPPGGEAKWRRRAAFDALRVWRLETAPDPEGDGTWRAIRDKLTTVTSQSLDVHVRGNLPFADSFGRARFILCRGLQAAAPRNEPP